MQTTVLADSNFALSFFQRADIAFATDKESTIDGPERLSTVYYGWACVKYGWMTVPEDAGKGDLLMLVEAFHATPSLPMHS
ncbi:uncharacterized protein N7483_009567 [Penicillium malachiteum]|uniref:uncharacterized protein n=1 Tax=Penicillium malachiteum TaxID=1324776 RepID=UPI0025496D4B|nr:uncharacterized protein N7483_009567 [Penicillium malachiteum]KAJ5721633.1 hypothetical protein N7483_009567 [Penicillium malachiteum]